MPTLIENIEFYHEIRNFSTADDDKTSTLKDNAGEKVRASIQFRVQIESRANVGNGDEFLVQIISGVTSITSNTADFVANGWRVGDTFTFTDNSGGGIGAAPGQIITLVSGNFMEITLNAPLVPNNYVNADLQLTTELDQLIFQYNFTDVSNQTDLVQQLLQSIQSFTYTGLTDLNFHPGVARQPVRGNTGSSQAKRRIITANFVQFFEVEHDFIVIPAGREDQLNNLQTNDIPDPYRNETVFYKKVIEMGVGGDNARLRSLPLDRVANDSVGWRNENFDGGANIFTVDSFSYSIPSLPNRRLSSIEAKATTSILATISTTGTFITGHPFVMHFSYLPEIGTLQSTSDDYQTATVFSSVRNTIDGVAVSGGVIKDLTGVLDGGKLKIQFDTEFTIEQLKRIFDDGAYEIYVSLADNSLTAELSNRVALSIDAARLTKSPDVTDLVLNESMKFYDHITDLVDTGNSSIEVWIEEGFLLDGSFDLNVGADLVDIEGLFIEIIAKNTNTDKLFLIKSYTIPTITQTVTTQPVAPFEQVQVLALDDTQGFLLKAGDQNNFLKISNGSLFAGNQNYGYKIGLKMSWQDWEKLKDADGSFFDTNELNNGLNKKADRYSGENNYVIKIRQVLRVRKGGIITTYNATSPEFKVFDYEKDRNVTPDFTGSMVFKDENNNGLSDNLIKNEDATVTVTFDDGNTKTDPNEFEAIVRLQLKNQGTDDSMHEISTLRGVLSGDILKPLPGDTNAEKTIVAGNFTTKILVDGLDITSDQYSISSELFIPPIPGFSIKSIFFNGVDEWIDCGDNIELFPENDDNITFSGWIKLSATGSIETIFANNEAANTRGITFIVDAVGKLKVSLVSTATSDEIIVETTAAQITDIDYHQVAFTYDGSETAAGLLIYVDITSVGVVTVQDTLTGTIIPGTKEFGLGGNSNSANLFSGYIDEAFFSSDRAWTGSDITAITACPEDLSLHTNFRTIQSWWRMGEGDTISSITDQLTRTWSQLNGVDAYVDVANDNSLRFSILDKFSISFWMRTTDITANVIGKTTLTSPNAGYTIRFNATNIFVELRQNGTSWIQKKVTANNIHNTGEWTHILFTHGGVSSSTVQHVYVNNVDEAMTTPVDNLTGDILSNNSLKIGDAFYGNLNGGIAHVAIFNDELSAADTDNIFMQGMNNPDYTGITGALTHLRMDTLNPVDVIGSNDGTSINMLAGDILDDISDGTPQNMDSSNIQSVTIC